MANRVVGLILVAGVGLAFSPAVFAQGGQSRAAAAEVRPAPRLPNGKSDLSGVWTRSRESTGRHFSGVNDEQRQGRVVVAVSTSSNRVAELRVTTIGGDPASQKAASAGSSSDRWPDRSNIGKPVSTVLCGHR